MKSASCAVARRDHGRGAVADRRHGDAGAEVDQPVAVHVLDDAAARAGHEDRQGRRRPRRRPPRTCGPCSSCDFGPGTAVTSLRSCGTSVMAGISSTTDASSPQARPGPAHPHTPIGSTPGPSSSTDRTVCAAGRGSGQDPFAVIAARTTLCARSRTRGGRAMDAMDHEGTQTTCGTRLRGPRAPTSRRGPPCPGRPVRRRSRPGRRRHRRSRPSSAGCAPPGPATPPACTRTAMCPRPPDDPDRVTDRRLIGGALLAFLTGFLVWSLLRNGYIPLWREPLTLLTPKQWWQGSGWTRAGQFARRRRPAAGWSCHVLLQPPGQLERAATPLPRPPGTARGRVAGRRVRRVDAQLRARELPAFRATAAASSVLDDIRRTSTR